MIIIELFPQLGVIVCLAVLLLFNFVSTVKRFISRNISTCVVKPCDVDLIQLEKEKRLVKCVSMPFSSRFLRTKAGTKHRLSLFKLSSLHERGF